MRNVLISLKKELRAIFRDKKFLSIILFMPLIIPAFIVGMGYLYDSINEVKDTKVGINYQMDDDEKAVFDVFKDSIELVYDNQENLQKKLENDEISGYVLKDNNTYTLYIDTSSSSGMALNEVLNNHYSRYNNVLASKYLVENNINPNDVFNIIDVKLEEQAQEGSSFFSNYIISFA